MFYFIFKSNIVNQKTLTYILVLLCFFTLVEALLINTLIPPFVLPNFPDYDQGLTEWVEEGSYQRPYSFGASATVASSLLVVLMAVCNVQGWRLWLSMFTVLAFLSGTGLFALLLLLLVKYRRHMLLALFPLALALLISSYFFVDVTLSIYERIMNKIGIEYLSVLIDLKLSHIVRVYSDLEMNMMVFGDPNGFRGGDFGFLAFLISNGFLGVMLFLLLLIQRINKANFFPLILIVATTFHYPVMFFLPGQMLLGLLLSMKKSGLPNPTVSEKRCLIFHRLENK